MKICTIDIDNKGLIETIEFHQEEIKRLEVREYERSYEYKK